MEIVVRGRNVEVPEHFRQHVEDKVGQLDRFDGKLKIAPHRRGALPREEPAPVGELPARGDHAARQGPGRPGRGLRARLLRGARPGRPASSRTGCAARPTAAGCTTAAAPRPACGVDRQHRRRRHRAAPLDLDRQLAEGPHVTDLDEHLPGRIVREKQHPATPMTVDQALHEMELVGHDFFLFHCADTGQPTVVYRRHAYDYGLIRLTETPAERRRRARARSSTAAATA